jgi:hypothetical protein
MGRKKTVRRIRVQGKHGRWTFDLYAPDGNVLIPDCRSAWSNSYHQVDGEAHYMIHCQDDPAAAARLRNNREFFPMVVIEPTAATKNAKRHEYDHPVNILFVQATGRGHPDRDDVVEVKALIPIGLDSFQL